MLCCAVGLGILLLMNWVHFRIYFKVISKDEDFIRWEQRHCCVNSTSLVIGTAFTFKFYRLSYSKFLEKESLSMVVSSINKLIPFNVLTLLSVFLSSFPIMAGCGLALYFSIAVDQEFFVALDTLIATGLVALFMLLDMKHPHNYFIDEHETNVFGKKTYLEESEKIEAGSNNDPLLGIGDSKEQLGINHEDVEGAYDTTDKIRTGAENPQYSKELQLNSLNKSKNVREGSQEFIDLGEDSKNEESEGEESGKKLRGWEPKTRDHHGYLMKYDENGDILRYDEHGYLVKIDEEGVHHKYNKDGHEVVIEGDQHILYDANGFIVDEKGGKRDSRGYRVEENEDGTFSYFDKNGFKV